MPELTPDKKLLEFLNQFGIGNYQQITHVLYDIFPYAETDNLEEYINRIELFLSDMQENDFIKSKDVFPQKIAAIQPKGLEYLNSSKTNIVPTPFPAFHVSGKGHKISYQSPSSSIDSNNSTTPQAIKKSPSSISKILINTSSIVRILGGIILLIGSAITLYYKCNGNSVKDVENPVDSGKKIDITTSIVSPRHFTVEDLKVITKIIPQNASKVFIDVSNQESENDETKNYRTEIYNAVNKIYQNVSFLNTPFNVPNENERFDIQIVFERYIIRVKPSIYVDTSQLSTSPKTVKKSSKPIDTFIIHDTITSLQQNEPFTTPLITPYLSDNSLHLDNGNTINFQTINQLARRSLLTEIEQSIPNKEVIIWLYAPMNKPLYFSKLKPEDFINDGYKNVEEKSIEGIGAYQEIFNHAYILGEKLPVETINYKLINQDDTLIKIYIKN